jgi:hypothetical protein
MDTQNIDNNDKLRTFSKLTKEDRNLYRLTILPLLFLLLANLTTRLGGFAPALIGLLFTVIGFILGIYLLKTGKYIASRKWITILGTALCGLNVLVVLVMILV